MKSPAPHDGEVRCIEVAGTSLDNSGPFASPEFWREEAARRHPGNTHLAEVFAAPWTTQLLCTPGSGRLWRSKRRTLLKELSESYAALRRVRAQAEHACGADGTGLVVFDVCSGKGVASLLLSVALPGCRVVMVDSNAKMDLSHLSGRANVEFHALSVYDDAAIGSLFAREARGAAWCVMVGTHLCGALSPRLIELYCRELDGVGSTVHGLILSPCCLKGWLGKTAQRKAEAAAGEGGAEAVRAAAARAAGFQASSYACLLAELHGLLLSHAGGSVADVAQVEYDEQVLSPVNGFLVATRRASSTSAVERQT